MKLKLYLILFLAICQQMLAQSDYYWVGGGGDWNDLNHWRIGSSSGQQATIIPSRYDNVFFTNNSGLGSGGYINANSVTCKNFTVDDNFSGKITFYQANLNIYGNIKWRGNIESYNSITMNLITDNNPTPNLIDIQLNNTYSLSYSINVSGNSSVRLMNNLALTGQLSIGDNAVFESNNKNIAADGGIAYTSSKVSDFGTSQLTVKYAYWGTAEMSLNANANLSQATVSARTLRILTSQNIKNIVFEDNVNFLVGTYLKADNISIQSGTFYGPGQYEINTLNSEYAIVGNASNSSSSVPKFKVNTMTVNTAATFEAKDNEITNLTLGKGANFNSGKYSIDNLTFNGGVYNFLILDYFKVNQTLKAYTVCGESNEIKGYGSSSTYRANLQIPPTINNGTGLSFPGYKLTNVGISTGTTATAGQDGGGNTSNITFTGVAAKTYYRIGGGGNWRDPMKWSLSSGGTPANCLPTMYDDVIFDVNSGFATNNNTLTATTMVSVRNMTWSNAPGNPIYDVGGSYAATTIYGNLYLQKNMTLVSNASFYFSKYNTSSAPTSRYMNFEGQKIGSLNLGVNDNFYLQPASWAAPYDVIAYAFSGGSESLFADNTKISTDENINGSAIFLSGKFVSINNALLRTKTLYVTATQPINAQNTTVYINKEYQSSNANHFFDKIYKEGNDLGIFTNVKANLLQINNAGSSISFSGTNSMKDLKINAPVDILMYNNTDNLKITDTFTYDRADCDLIMKFTGNGGKNLVLGNTINGTGFVNFNRMNISGINASYVTPVAGTKPVNANNSIDSGSNSGITFTTPTARNFYWKGGYGNWNDLSHWSLDPSAARTTANCGLPTIYDNVFFDENSGFINYSASITLESHVSVNNLTLADIPNLQNFVFSSKYDNDFYTININGDLKLVPIYFDANSFGGFTFINTYKPSGSNKSVYPNSASTKLTFAGDANWKVYHGTGVNDMSGGAIIQQGTSRTLDLSGTVLNLTRGASFEGKEILLNNSDITVINNLNFNTQQPVISNNSVLKVVKNYRGPIFSANNLAHYFERIDVTGIFGDYYNPSTFIFPNGTINYMNILPATENGANNPYPSVIFNSLNAVNHLNIQKKNIISLASNIKVNQSMLLQGDCLETNSLVIKSNNTTARQIVIPTYNSTDFVIDKARLQYISSSGGQTYTATNSKDLGSNTGISFIQAASPVSRNLYWVGGQGEWNNIQNWSLSSGGTPITTSCDLPGANDNVFFDQNSGFTASQSRITINNINAYAKNVTFNNTSDTPELSFYSGISLEVSGNITLQENVRVSSMYPNTEGIKLVQGSTSGQTRYIDTKGINTVMTITATQDNFELQSAFTGILQATNVKSFKTNNHPILISRNTYYSSDIGFLFDYTQNINPVLDFGQSVITCFDGTTRTFRISSNNQYPVTILASDAKITAYSFIINVPNANNFGEVYIATGGTLNAGPTLHNFNKAIFLGNTSFYSATSTLVSSGNYKTLYFNPGTYKIAGGQTVTENLFMTGTPCNRISVSKTAASGQSAINLSSTANYTMFYASIQDVNFSRAVNAYGNSQDLGNTTNLTIVPTNVQAAGFGGNKILCASEFPKTYDAAALFGTDPNASYTWTKTGWPDAGVISTSPQVTFTQPGDYSVKVVYSQDGCNITENFNIASIAPPVDTTITTPSSALQQPTGDVAITLQGSLDNQTYIFTYSINDGPDMEVMSNANGVAMLNQPRNVVGTFVYHLKGIRFADGTICPAVTNNKDLIVNINPDCSTPGVVQLYGNELRGCTASMGARRLTELSSVAVVNPPSNVNIIQLVPGTGIVIKEGADVFLLRNSDALPETLLLPTDKPYTQGAVIYHNDHFYEGVENGKWIRIDND